MCAMCSTKFIIRDFAARVFFVFWSGGVSLSRREKRELRVTSLRRYAGGGGTD